MKYNNLRKCMNLAEEMCKSSGMDIADADVDIIQHNDKGYTQWVSVKFDYEGAKVDISITPKGNKNEMR